MADEYQANDAWTDLNDALALWMMDHDGNGRTPFVQNARGPEGSPVALPGLIECDHFGFLPLV